MSIMPWTPLVAKSLSEGRWQLMQPLEHQFTWNGRIQKLVVPAGFVTDLFSIPAFLHSMFSKDNIANRAAVQHDWTGAADLVPAKIRDLWFKQDCLWFGIPKWKCDFMYAAVRVHSLILYRDSARDVCRQRKLAGLFNGDYTTVDPKDVPRPLWPSGNIPYYQEG
jgi:hypothetical protein